MEQNIINEINFFAENKLISLSSSEILNKIDEDISIMLKTYFLEKHIEKIKNILDKI